MLFITSRTVIFSQTLGSSFYIGTKYNRRISSTSQLGKALLGFHLGRNNVTGKTKGNHENIRTEYYCRVTNTVTSPHPIQANNSAKPIIINFKSSTTYLLQLLDLF